MSPTINQIAITLLKHIISCGKIFVPHFSTALLKDQLTILLILELLKKWKSPRGRHQYIQISLITVVGCLLQDHKHKVEYLF